jgi:polar amino acid transport system substrate-binding protein
MKNSPCYIGLNKGEEKLKEKVNAIIAKARQDGRLDAISKKWLGLSLPGDLPS